MTPGCSTCGSVVEWLRSCYQSHWRVWRNSPELVIPGRYAFAASGARHFPYLHNVGSRNWFQNEPWHSPALGEVQDGKQLWFGGKLPELPPPDTVVGQQDCFRNGAIYPQGLDQVDDWVGGFPKRCWAAPAQIPILTASSLNINDRATQLAIAQVLELLYTDAAAAAVLLQSFLDRPAVITTHSAAGSVFPGIIVARTDAYTVVIVNGSDNNLQRVLSAFYSTMPPVPAGGFATNSFFNLVANFVASFMFTSGVDASLPILYAGHSLGGAITNILAARTVQANPTADVRLMTYGTPRPGDAALRTIIGNIASVNIVNVGDYISQLPPVPSEYYPLAAEVVTDYGVSWVGWTDTANRMAIDVEGRVVAPSALAITWPELSNAIEIVLDGAPFPPLEAHSISEYVRRLGLIP